ncbi:MAG: GNAT family N-acetyltransferase [Candidatus Acidifodinimicrobium sp.]
MEGVEIGYCSKEDKAYISDLFMRTFKKKPWNSRMNREDVDSYLDSILESDDSICLIARANGQTSKNPVGFAFGSKLGYVINKEINEKTTTYLTSIAVEPALRGMGVGSQLLSAYMKKAEELNFNYLSLITSTKSTETLNFYEKHGLSRLENERDHSPESTKSGNIFMIKEISQRKIV